MRPVLEGMCHYESLKDGTVDLFDLSRMNDMISARDENNYRAHEAMKNK